MGNSNITFAEKHEMDIYVNIVNNQYSTEIFSAAEVSVSDAKTGKVLYAAKPNERLVISAGNGNFTIANKNISATKLLVASKDATKYLTINKKAYRGQAIINLDKANKRLTVVNILPLEEYLYGVVPQEMPHNWPKDALKAQAVAARTFAMNSIGTRDTKGYDVDSTTNSQVYNGVTYENPTVNKLIDETRGEIITYQGKTIQAFFHSSAGGYTENAQNVWGTDIPYLKAVEDYDQKSSRYSWDKIFTPEEIDNIFKNAGYKIGRVQSFVVSDIKKPPMSVADRGVSGRVKEIKIIGDQGFVVVTGNKMRQLLKLDSTLFDIIVTIPLPKKITSPILDGMGNQVGQREILLDFSNQDVFYNVKNNKNLKKVTRAKGESIIVYGRGFGHGLGMSQWGAKFLAENSLSETNKDPKTVDNSKDKDKKKKKDKSTTDKPLETKKESPLLYQKILKHYYTGVEIVKAY